MLVLGSLEKADLENLASDPTPASRGRAYFNTTTGKMKIYSGSQWVAQGGGGGGAGFKWNELGGNSAVPSFEYSENNFLFTNLLAQELYATIKVPQSYTPGAQIFLYVTGYSPATSNTILLRTQSTLVRKTTDAFDSTTNQRTSTNSALTNSVANQLREFALDLTSSLGTINGVAVAAGDVIKVRLYRDTDTDTQDLRMIPNSTDITFS